MDLDKFEQQQVLLVEIILQILDKSRDKGHVAHVSLVDRPRL